VKYTKTTPCTDCPFLEGTERGFTDERLAEFASGEFPCHKTADATDDEFFATRNSVHCAGALICLEKRNLSRQMMRITERFGMYDHTKLDMEAPVR
jgi:hypothetical protein